MKKVLVTGAAGFIGYHLCTLLTQNEFSVTGIDSLNSYYDLSLKLDRVECLTENPHFRFSYQGNPADVMRVNAEDSEGMVFSGKSTPSQS